MFFKINNEKNGYSLIELMIGMTILIVAISSYVPILMNTTQSALRNTYRTVSYNLGIKQIERIKSLNYDDVGVSGGNPSGTLASTSSEAIDGINYMVKVKVTWQDDPVDGTEATTDSDPRDYKTVKVTITPPSSSGLKSQVFTTNITRQSEEQITVGGHIKVTVVDPFVDPLNAETPIEDATVKITTGPDSPQNIDTDETGLAAFYTLDPSLVEGDYTITAEKTGYVLEPTIESLTTTVVVGQTQNKRLSMSQPGTLNLSLIDDDTGELITSSSNISLIYPSANAVNYSSKDGSFIVNNLYPGRYELRASNATYELATEYDVGINASEATVLTIRLRRKIPGTLHLTVTDQQLSNPISNANIIITGLDNALTETGGTNASGVFDLDLFQQNYQLEVNASGYQQNIINFNVISGQVTNVNNVLQLEAILNGSLTVYLKRNNGVPRPSKKVKVLGPNSYDERIDTNINGQALFNGLIPTGYEVYRINNSNWIYIGQYQVGAGENKIVTVKY